MATQHRRSPWRQEKFEKDCHGHNLALFRLRLLARRYLQHIDAKSCLGKFAVRWGEERAQLKDGSLWERAAADIFDFNVHTQHMCVKLHISAIEWCRNWVVCDGQL